MITIPHRLLDAEFVQVHGQKGSVIILEKQLDTQMLERPSYLSMHAISIVLAGKQHISTQDGPGLTLVAGEIGFIRKGLYNVTDLLPEAGRFHSLHLFFDEKVLTSLWTEPASKGPTGHLGPFFRQASPAWLPAYLEGLRAILPSAPALSSLKLEEFLQAILQSPQQAPLHQFLYSLQLPKPLELMPFMRAHVFHPFNVADYASLTGRSESTFRREFKQKTGSSPRQWIIEQRLTRARELLDQGTKGVATIAQQVGYQHVSHFIQAFKKAYGHTPSQKAG